MNGEGANQPVPDFVIEGVVPVIPTPFQPDTEAIDLEALGGLIDFAATLDVSAVCLPAYASEFYKLSEAEHFQIVEAAVKASDGAVPIVAQSNHPSAHHAADMARRNSDLGADFISFAMPRLFSVTSEDLLDYCTTICDAVTLPVLVQDFNPGGPTIDATFCARLQAACPNFRYVKLEEPLMGEKVKAIRDATQDQIGVLEGWGGMYTLELIPYGICGLMPGLGCADLLARIWRLGKAGQIDAALDIFQMILPQLLFSLQNLELFLHIVGSHKLGGIKRQDIIEVALQDPDNLIHHVVAPAGSTLLFFESLLHSGGICTSGKERVFILGGYWPSMFQAHQGYEPNAAFLKTLPEEYHPVLTGSRCFQLENFTRELKTPAEKYPFDSGDHFNPKENITNPLFLSVDRVAVGLPATDVNSQAQPGAKKAAEDV